MSLNNYTTQEVADLIIAQLESELSQSIPLLPRSFSRVLAKALSGVYILLYRYAGFMLLQQFPQHASTQPTTINGKTIIPLVEWGRLIGVGDPTEATRAELVIEVTVTEQTGTLPSASLLLRSETGVTYQTLYPVDLDAATVQVTVRAVDDEDGNDGAGVLGNLDTGDELSFVSPLANVSSIASVVSATVTAADGEDLGTTYRARVVGRMQSPPQGGAYADYRAWAEEVEGIIHAYPYTADDPGQVDVYCEASTASCGDEDGIPTADQLTAVYNSILYDDSGAQTRKPANDAVNVYPITRTAFDVEITGLDTLQAMESEATIKANLAEALDEYLRNLEPYIEGVTTLPRRDRVTQGGVAAVVESVLNAVGASCDSIALQEEEVEISGRSLEHGEKAKLGEPEYA
jgi:uncharacterized phage protein gp47/JayE